jgi:hypothetical protein
MKWNLRLSLFFVALFYAFGPNVYADMCIESVNTTFALGRQMGKEEHQKTYFTADKMKTIQDGGKITIIRLDKGLIWNIDGSKKTYTEMTFKGMKESAQQAMKLMEDSMANIPPEQRKLMEQFKPHSHGPKKPKTTLERTGKMKDVSGYKCELIVGSTRTTRTELWATKQVEYSKDAKNFFEALSSVFSEFPSFQEESFIDDSLIELGFFPIETKKTSTGDPRGFSSTSIITKIEHKEFNDSEFELPEGLKKVNAGMPH